MDDDDCYCSDLDGVSDRCPTHMVVTRAQLAAAREEGRAAGIEEAIEKAANAAHRLCGKLSGVEAKAACELVAQDILKLAPATTKEP